MNKEIDAEWLLRLAHYAFTYIPGPRWSEREAASRAKQAHLNGVIAGQLAEKVEEYPGLLDRVSGVEKASR